MILTIAPLRVSTLFLAAIAGLIFFSHTGPAAAEEQTLRFKLVTQQVGVPSALPEIGGHKVRSASTSASRRSRMVASLISSSST